METQSEHEEGLWKRIKGRIKWVFDELKADSVGENPEKPIDCCHPPEYHKAKKN